MPRKPVKTKKSNDKEQILKISNIESLANFKDLVRYVTDHVDDAELEDSDTSLRKFDVEFQIGEKQMKALVTVDKTVTFRQTISD